MGRNKLFISYSHNDTRWLEALTQQLAVLEREGLLSLCDDTKLKVGEDWQQQLNDMMLEARLGLLLISAPFLNSEFVREKEIPRLFQQHQQGGMQIYPLLVEPCPWERVAWLTKLQLRPQDSKRRVRPLSAFQRSVRTQKMADIANEIANLIAQ
ncbi:MAG TPA: toll/interleukin-1 receptor domain-containing protein [Pyrinomonadaceae bacterium]|nr:toll/interleukin-1 receptor domain-containing protein [Pyrinomonadaceae bacterium]